jgi:hypothetical protein
MCKVETPYQTWSESKDWLSSTSLNHTRGDKEAWNDAFIATISAAAVKINY